MDPVTSSHGGHDHLPAAAALVAVAALSDELRRRMYGFIRRVGRPVSREEAAKSVGISRKLAAFHLDKLVEVGLLRARYEPVGGFARWGALRRSTNPPTRRYGSASRPGSTICWPASSSMPYSPKIRARSAAKQLSRSPVTTAPSSAPPNVSAPGRGAWALNVR